MWSERNRGVVERGGRVQYRTVPYRIKVPTVPYGTGTGTVLYGNK